jgi:hypothetical protein
MKFQKFSALQRCCLILLVIGGYPPKPGHDVTSSTYGEDLMALSGQGQRLDLR